jgi:hypothetical protein
VRTLANASRAAFASESRTAMLAIADEEAMRLELSLEIAEDARRASEEFWKAWLWQSREIVSRPSVELCTRLSARFDISTGEICRQWLEWYGLLTSWELASALVGSDVRSSDDGYGISHRRA